MKKLHHWYSIEAIFDGGGGVESAMIDYDRIYGTENQTLHSS